MARTKIAGEEITTPVEELEVVIAAGEKAADEIEIPVSKLVRYRKIGGGSLRIDGRIIKPNQTFSIDPDRIPKAFLSTLVCLEPDRLSEVLEIPVKKVDTTFYEIREKTAKGWFGVYRRSDGKELTTKTLKEADAIAMVETLNKG